MNGGAADLVGDGGEINSSLKDRCRPNLGAMEKEGRDLLRSSALTIRRSTIRSLPFYKV